MNSKASSLEAAVLLATLIISAVLITLMLSGWSDCSRRAGTYVRTAVWFACVDQDGTR